jgi:hypothetical protein
VAKVLDFLSLTVEISEPGLYVLERDWDAPGLSLIISGNGITVDLNGFSLNGGSPTVLVTGNDAAIRNGRLTGNGPLTTTGNRTSLSSLSIEGGTEGLIFGGIQEDGSDRYAVGGGSRLRDSRIVCPTCVPVTIQSPGVIVERTSIWGRNAGIDIVELFNPDDINWGVRIINNGISCVFGPCLELNMPGNEVLENRIAYGEQADPNPRVLIAGYRNRIADNGFWASNPNSAPFHNVAIHVTGRDNLIQRNYSLGGALSTGLLITGEGNCYQSNLISISDESSGSCDLGGNVESPL